MPRTVVIGAGPAGLTAGYELARRNLPAVVLEKGSQVGGLSRTVERRGFRFDIGGHRFFTKSPVVRRLWAELLEDDMLSRSRMSRIYYDGQFFDYPLKPWNALSGLGPVESVRILMSYVKARLGDPKDESFEDWVSHRFGRRLYEIFFKTYTEKVWGVPCSEISADWASQRIKNLDLWTALWSAFTGSGTRDDEIVTTLIDRFQYPRKGPGMMWNRCRQVAAEGGVETLLETRAETVRHAEGRVAEVIARGPDGERRSFPADHVLSSMPLRHLIHSLDPVAPREVQAAADRLHYRDFLTVVLVIDGEHLFPDNWIYIHEPDVRVGRIQNYKNWSPEMVPDPAKTALGLEYFVTEGDELWTASDDELRERGARECARLGLVEPDEVEDAFVLRIPKAYPVYDQDYRFTVQVLRRHLARIRGLEAIGRNGQHRYNNQDHSMLTGLYAARNVDGADYDVWSVNVSSEYHEEERLQPSSASASNSEANVAAGSGS